MEASKLGFGVVIGRSDNGLDRRCVFVTMTCERIGTYKTPLQNFKRDSTSSKKRDCPFKVRGYMLANKNRRFNVISGLHNPDVCEKLVGHPSVCRLMPEEKECVADMILNLVQPKNILAALKRKRPKNISNFKQMYNIRHLTNRALRGDRIEMEQLLKLLDDNSYVSRYRTCEDEVTVRDIFWTHLDSIKLFNTFSTVLILDSTYKINKYRFPSLEIVGVTSIEKTYFVGFAILECEKRTNFTWVLEVCRTLLKDQSEMPKAIVTNCDTALMNLVANVFPSSNALLFRKVCGNYPDLLKYVESTILDQLVGNISRASLNYIFHEAKRADNVGSDSAKCGYTIVKTYGLSCACVIAKKVKLGDPIKMDEVYTHWKRLRFDDDGVMNDGKSNISNLTKWKVIQERFLKVSDNMKLHIKEQLRKIVYPKTTDMKPPSQPIKTKSALKKMKLTPNDNLSTLSPSYFEHVNKVFPDSPTPKNLKKVMSRHLR
ncbi:protein FAR-RED ELONGATED HYPOCOTYL 3-like [Lathyrus oleraceus]|uniref:protein FAR-RED ELONGATED HYPOCOTYL 3-like n=1 Tax=Pisum sativum TaxID=3888 RepID=UPI0021D354CB|nr:protein FAR-RED ELONGATED HYPOCOTYL 3-like [Pisum sativum]